MAISVENHTLIDKLKETFGEPETVAPYGDCIIIPHDKFLPEWGPELAKMGISHSYSSMGGESVVLVRLKKPLPDGKTPYVYTPPPQAPKPPAPAAAAEELKAEETQERRGRWHSIFSKQEDEELISLWNEKPNIPVAKIAQKLEEKFKTGKTQLQVQGRLTQLQNKEKIQPRFNRNGFNKNDNANKWSAKEDALLVALWLQRPQLTVEQIHVQLVKQFPNRNLNSVCNRIHRLQVKGKIKRRLEITSDKIENTVDAQQVYGKPEAPKPEETPSLGISVSTSTDINPSIVELLKDIETGNLQSLDKIAWRIRELLGEKAPAKEDTSLKTALEAFVKIQQDIEDIKQTLKTHKHAIGTGEAMTPINL